MSGRLLRKVLKEQEEEEHHQKSVDAAELEGLKDDDSDSPDSHQPSRNPFDLLDDQVDEIEDEMGNSAGDINEQEYSVKKSSSAVLPSANRKSKKKKKKTKEPQASKEKAGEPIEKILESLNMDTNSSSSSNAKASSSKIPDNQMKQRTLSVLAADPKFLRPENELRRIFGSDVVRSFENGHNSGSSRQIRGGRRGTRNLRKTILVSPSPHWAPWDGSLSMELLETKDGLHCFKYVHSSSYSQAQRSFEAAKAINDLNSIASIVQYDPYHIESLITLSEVLKFSGEHEASADLISKCLFALECSWHPLFTPLQGNCQLKYGHDTNKPLFSVLFTHMQNMDRRGCHRSALEVCKLLLSLDSDDPMGAIFCIDYFSLRAEEYAWLERFSEEYKSDNSLWLYPNFSYSLAICRFYLEREASSKNASMESDKATSSDLMKQALFLHPSVLKKLVEKTPLKDAAWTRILNHTFFGSAQVGGPSLEHLINIYVERSYIMWRLPDLQRLLRDAAEQVVETLNSNGTDAKDWACVRKETFASEKNEYSHLLVSDFSTSVPTMPPEEMRNLMIDPHVAQAMHNAGPGINPEAVARAPRDVQDRNPVVVFLESLLPWVDYGTAPGDDQQNGHDEEDEY